MMWTRFSRRARRSNRFLRGSAVKTILRVVSTSSSQGVQSKRLNANFLGVKHSINKRTASISTVRVGDVWVQGAVVSYNYRSYVGMWRMVGVRTEYLRGLGIDVWVTKPTGRNTFDNRASPLVGQSRSGLSESSVVRSDRTTAVGPRFRIRGFRLERVLGLVSEEAFPDMSLILDIARAINVFKCVKADEFVFVWPQVEGSDSSWVDATNAFDAFCNSRIGSEDIVLAVGVGLTPLMTTQNLSPEQLIALDAVPRTANEKHELWKQIRVLAR